MESLDKLKDLKTLLKKNGPNKLFKKSYVDGKKEEALKFKRECDLKFESSFARASPEEKVVILQFQDEYEKEYKKCLELINRIKIIEENEEDIEISDLDSDISTQANMSLFDFQKALKVIPEFDGTPEKLSNFLELVEFYSQTLRDAEQVKLFLSFVLKARLADKVKNKLLLEENSNTYDEFKSILLEKFKGNKTPTKILNELNSLKQKSSTVSEFATKVEGLVAELNMLQVGNLGASSSKTVKLINDGIGLNAFKSGLNNPMKDVVFAARPETLSDAVSVALEREEQNPKSESNVFNMKKHNSKNSRGSSKNSRGNFRGRQFSRGNSSSHQNSRGNSHNNSQRGRGNFKQNFNRGHGQLHGNYRGNYSSRGNYYTSRSTYNVPRNTQVNYMQNPEYFPNQSNAGLGFHDQSIPQNRSEHSQADISNHHRYFL